MSKQIYNSYPSWILQQLKNTHDFLYLQNNAGRTGVDAADFDKIDQSFKRIKTEISALIPKPDISTYGNNGIFTQYFLKLPTHKLNFEDYFYQCLNPDFAPPGFLEELNRLIQINKNRKVAIATDYHDAEQLKAADVLYRYLSGIPPF